MYTISQELVNWINQPYPNPPFISKDKPVCVTGASGFIAGNIIKALVPRGYTVHGTIRNKNKPAPHMAPLDPSGKQLVLFSADLLQPDSFDEAVKDCDCVFHTASPFVMDIKDPQKDLVDPAVQGTLNVLNACLRNGVKKVILTSSCVAVADHGIEGKVFTEDDFNTISAVNRNPYYFSKIQAELAAWNFVRENPSIHLVSINPMNVIGPTHLKTIGESSEIICNMMKGAMKANINIGIGVVDVRDVAEAHVLAMESTQAHGRYIICKETVMMEEISKILSEEFPEYTANLPSYNLTGPCGNFIVGIMANFASKGIKDFLKTNVGHPAYYDSSRVQSHLGLNLRPARESLVDTVRDMIAHGHISPPK